MIYSGHSCDKGAHKNYRLLVFLLVFFFFSAAVTLAVISWHFKMCLGVREGFFLSLRKTWVTPQNWEVKKLRIFYSWNLSNCSVNLLSACHYLMLAYNEAKLADWCFFHTDCAGGRTWAVCHLGRQGSMEAGEVERQTGSSESFSWSFQFIPYWSLKWLKVGSNNRLSLHSLSQPE